MKSKLRRNLDTVVDTRTFGVVFGDTDCKGINVVAFELLGQIFFAKLCFLNGDFIIFAESFLFTEPKIFFPIYFL